MLEGVTDPNSVTFVVVVPRVMVAGHVTRTNSVLQLPVRKSTDAHAGERRAVAARAAILMVRSEWRLITIRPPTA
jgi:hypothetical protein